jgi:hypothetical protein
VSNLNFFAAIRQERFLGRYREFVDFDTVSKEKDTCRRYIFEDSDKRPEYNKENPVVRIAEFQETKEE